MLFDFIEILRPFDPRQVGVMMSPEEADRLGLKPFGDGGAENETSPRLGATRFFCGAFRACFQVF